MAVADQTIADLELWVKMLTRAAEIHEGLPDPVRDGINSQSMEAELMTLVAHMASVSTRTRESFLRTCLSALERLSTTQLDAGGEIVDFPSRPASWRRAL